MRMVL